MRVGGRVGKSELVADRKLLADRKLDFQGDRVREGFAENSLLTGWDSKRVGLWCCLRHIADVQILRQRSFNRLICALTFEVSGSRSATGVEGTQSAALGCPLELLGRRCLLYMSTHL